MLDDRFKLERQLGRDSIAVTWQAVDVQLDRAVVVRVLHRELMDDPAVLERFRLEALAAAGLSHGNVASLFDVAVHDDVAYTVGEYVDGPPLSRLIDRGPMAPAAVAALGHQAASGLAAAHEAGIVHRDVRPGNLLVGRDGRVRIIDFGSARIPDPDHDRHDVGTPGSESYLAPEQLHERAVSTDRTDVYALGRTLLKALAGANVVFEDDVPDEGLLSRIIGAIPGLPVGDDVLRLLKEVITQATRLDPAERPSARELADALHGLYDTRGEDLLRPLVAELPEAVFGQRVRP